MNEKISVVIPTFNEKKNITTLLTNVQTVLDKITPNYEIIIVDDNSPDGTGKIINAISEKNRKIKLISRPVKSGLGDAYKTGFQQVTGDIVLEMDADLSHDPHDIPKFLRYIKNSDIIIGSRYIKGGGNHNRSKKRIIISKVANFLASIFFNLHLHDCTSGYRLYKRKVIDTIIPYIHCQKYTFQVEILEKAKLFHFSIAEVPIIFRDRMTGKSKFNLSEVSEFLKELFKRIFQIHRIKK